MSLDKKLDALAALEAASREDPRTVKCQIQGRNVLAPLIAVAKAASEFNIFELGEADLRILIISLSGRALDEQDRAFARLYGSIRKRIYETLAALDAALPDTEVRDGQ